MAPQLPFFPASLPDETLSSRASRFHILSCNATEQLTYNELFDQKPFALGQVVPPSIDVLAARLPGSEGENFRRLIEENTLFPLFRPFLGSGDSDSTRGSDGAANVELSHMPRHVVGMSGDAKLCLCCLRDDDVTHQLPYWHRAHQIPGVAVCWKHKIRTISSCPNCDHPFQLANKLLSAPWLVCRGCGNDIRTETSTSPATEIEHRFAVYAYELLYADIPAISPLKLTSVYRTQIQDRGYHRGSKTNMKVFQTSMIEALGEDFIKAIDPAYSAKRVRFWIRLHDSGLDMPITRHLLLGMHLFGTAERFRSAVLAESVDTSRIGEKERPKKEAANSMRDEHRKRVLDELRRRPEISLEELWKRCYRTTAWLFENDKIWLKKVMGEKSRARRGNALTDNAELAKKDKEYADLAEKHSNKLFNQQGKPSLVTMEKILVSLPKSIVGTSQEKERYPILFTRIAQCRESSWCFRARRILWAVSELRRLESKITAGNIVLVSSVALHAVHTIASFCGWDLETLGIGKISTLDELSRVGIGRTWRGPIEAKEDEIGGRAYRRIQPEKSNTHAKFI